MRTNEISDFAKLLSESSATEKQHLLAELARDLLKDAKGGKRVLIQDSSGELIAVLTPIGPWRPMPADENSPEFLQELRRRCDEGVTLTPDECMELLKSRD